MTATNSLINRQHLAIDWLLTSKIHNIDRSDKLIFGSFNNFYDCNKKQCQYAYTEITAYAVELLIDLYEKTGENKYLESARHAGDWIAGMQYLGNNEHSHGGFLHCIFLNDRRLAVEAYPFDAGIILSALSELYEKTDDQRYLDSAKVGAKWLTQKMQKADGSFQPLYNLSEQKYSTHISKSIRLNQRNIWYCLSGCHHGKIAIGLLKYFSKSKESRALVSAQSLLKWLITQQDKDGYFKTTINSNAFFSHTHCYATEALLFAHETLKNQDYLDAAILAADYLVRRQQKNGGIRSWEYVHQLVSYVDVSAVAQAIRIWSVVYCLTGNRNYKVAIERAMQYLNSMQSLTGNADSLGGHYLADLDIGLTSYRLKRLYSWVTIFGIHAMMLSGEIENRQVRGNELW